MNKRFIKISTLMIIILVLSACDLSKIENNSNDNLVNKINVVEDHWINYEGISENDKNMVKSQFIPYKPKENYEVSHDSYVSYFNGDEFIKTELYEDTPEIISSVEEADGIILSFNKEHKSGMQLTITYEP